MNYYPFHLGDYAAHTAHLEPMEDLAYRRMLDLYYLREGALPLEVSEVARLIRMRSEVEAVTSVLREFFVETETGWRHPRCDDEIAHLRRGPRWLLDVTNAEWSALRAQIFERDGYRCVYCGSQAARLECDHVFPLSLGGSSHPANLATACVSCNRSKGAKTLGEWGRV
jgi:uncharacterized protein YdaU (DUF1376 family)